MRFTLSQLYDNNKNKPFVRIKDSNEDLQWDYCDLEKMPDKITGTSYHNMGKTSTAPYEQLPKIFKTIDSNEYLIEDISTIWSVQGL